MKIRFFSRYSLEFAKADLKTIFSLFSRVTVDRIRAVEISYVGLENLNDSCMECLVLIFRYLSVFTSCILDFSFGFSDHVRC